MSPTKPAIATSRRTASSVAFPSKSASPVLDHVLMLLENLGGGVTLERRLQHTMLRRESTFAVVKDNPRGGIILGLWLPGTLVGGRLLDGMNFRVNRISHQVRLRNLEDIDEDVRAWLKSAYKRG